MNNPSMMVASKEIFPWIKEFYFRLGEDHWLIDDQYCVNPECGCRDVMIEFVCIAVSPDCRAKVVQQMPAARLDGRRHAFEPLNPPWAGEPTLETLANALREAYPYAARELQQRHQKLRLLYRKALKKNGRDAPRSSVRSSNGMPNAPCPYGSGKKFKKCCGRVM